jgi:heparosan-N-sulfate-glucuronate 5-epimerase
MSMRARLRETAAVVRDLTAMGTGRGYFHVAQPLGRFGDDPRCYYNDLRRKSEWRGAMEDGIPLLYVPRLGTHIKFPIMIIQYGLGCLDRLFLEGDERLLRPVAAVHAWMMQELEGCDHFDNGFPVLNPGRAYHSSNSGMAQGEAISFLVRLDRHLGARYGDDRTRDAIRRLAANMVKPVEEGGTAVAHEGRTAFCESCEREPHVVLNGWIFAYFGLHDHADWAEDPEARRDARRAAADLRRCVPGFLREDGWSHYDSRGTPASPFYQRLHIALLYALARLEGDPACAGWASRLEEGDSVWNRWRYGSRKLLDRLTRSGMHTSER